jgi:hypothetical protein
LIKEGAISLAKKWLMNIVNEKKNIVANEVMKHALKKPMFFPLGEGGRFSRF